MAVRALHGGGGGVRKRIECKVGARPTRPSPLQNRVRPDGALEAVSTRYDEASVVFGNRGVLHDNAYRVKHARGDSSTRTKAWLASALRVNRTRAVQRDDNRAFNGRKRTMFAPNRYTELFFLDEPTALAAGHRPCACCRRADYRRWMEAWSAAFPRDNPWTAAAVDEQLAAERSVRFSHVMEAIGHNALDVLPDGVFVRTSGGGGLADGYWMVWRSSLCRWSHKGYSERIAIAQLPAGTAATLVTPKSTVATLRAGFEPLEPHRSALPDFV